jgi:hypothetical protein
MHHLSERIAKNGSLAARHYSNDWASNLTKYRIALATAADSIVTAENISPDMTAQILSEVRELLRVEFLTEGA